MNTSRTKTPSLWQWPPAGPGNYGWDHWKRKALIAGLSNDLATLGRELMREAYQHDWHPSLCHECGWTDAGDAMIKAALKDPKQMEERWNFLLATDGGNYPEGAELLNSKD